MQYASLLYINCKNKELLESIAKFSFLEIITVNYDFYRDNSFTVYVFQNSLAIIREIL